MSALHPAVAQATRVRWPERGPVWSTTLPAELAELCADLGVTPTGRTFRARFAYVAEATTPAGARIVLRSSPDPDADNQAAVLEHLARAGLAPTVHLRRRTATATWTAMDAIAPGTSLAERAMRTADMANGTTMLRTLSAATAGPAQVPSIIPWLRARLTDPPADDQPPDRGPQPEHVRHAAIAVLDQLTPDTTNALCHGDLSLTNVIRGASRLWFIDPRGVNGEAAYDIAVLALKTSRGNLHDARVLATALARRSGNDPDRAIAWTLVAAAATV